MFRFAALREANAWRCVIAGLALSSCAPSEGPSDSSIDSRDASSSGAALGWIRSVEGALSVSGVDVWEVFVCRIPEDHDRSLYDMDGLRLVESAQWVTDTLEPAASYFRRWSRGAYAIEFRAARTDLTPEYGGSEECVAEALKSSSPHSHGVLVVADAQHREDRGGGWGRKGLACDKPCPAQTSQRAVYLGAADFVAGPPVPMDLVEHELGHAIGWPHSSRDVEYDSAVDLMSDSAARRRIDPSSVDAPGVLAFNRYLAGWILDEPNLVEVSRSISFAVHSGNFAVVALTARSAVTIELIEDSGDMSHVSGHGVALHVIEWTVRTPERSVSGAEESSCTVTVLDASEDRCAAYLQPLRLIAPKDSPDGLARSGDVVEIAGLRIGVDEIADDVDSIRASVSVAVKSGSVIR